MCPSERQQEPWSRLFYGVRQGGEPMLERDKPALHPKRFMMLFQQIRGLSKILAGNCMPNRILNQSMLRKPTGGAAMEFAGQLGVTTLQTLLQQIGKKLMIAIQLLAIGATALLYLAGLM